MNKIILLCHRLKDITKDLEIHNRAVFLIEELESEFDKQQKEIDKLQKEVGKSWKKRKK